MKRRVNFRWFIFLVLLTSFLFSHPFVSYAETDVTSKIELVKSSLMYDRRAGTSYFDVYLRNISQDILLTPIRVVIENLSPSGVTVANADGVTSEGKPYFEYVLPLGKIENNQSTDNKRWIFYNPNRVRFSYVIKIMSRVAAVANQVGNQGGFIQVLDPNSTLYGTSVDIPPGALQENTLITISGVEKPFPLPGGYLGVGECIEFGPENTIFSTPVIVGLPYNDKDIDGTTLSESKIGVKYFNKGTNKWEDVEVISQDTALNIIYIQVNHFSIFIAGIFELQGTWNFHSLVAGGDQYWNGWVYGQVEIDENGIMTNTSIVRSNGNNILQPSMTLSVSQDGIITSPDDPTLHAAVNQTRDLIVWTRSAGWNGIRIMQKAGGTFAQSNLVGTWNFHMLGAGNSSEWNGWVHGQMQINASGWGTPASIVASSNVVLTPATVSISSNGVVSMSGTTGHAVMNQNHDLIVGTFTSGDGRGYGLMIMQKADGTTFQTSDLDGDWWGHGLVSGYAPYQQIGWLCANTFVDGNVTWLSYMDSTGKTSLPRNGPGTYIDSTGIITTDNPDVYGIMNPSKDMFVMTYTGWTGGGNSIGR